MIRAVTFDFWDTLVSDDMGTMRGLQLDAWTDVLTGAGMRVDRDDLADAFAANWLEFEQRWHANDGQWTPRDATGHIGARLGVSGELHERLADTFRLVGEQAPLVAADGAAETLDALKRRGVALGIVCDVGLTSAPTLRERLRRFGLLEYFDAWSFSDETGWFKPAAGAFAPALDAMGIQDPSQVAHIGDSKRTDIAGALALGMTAVRFTGFCDRRDGVGPEAPLVLARLQDLPAALRS